MTINTIATKLRARQGESLTLDEMRRSLPSIFAAEPHDSRSERYVYISTEDMLGQLMGAGFLPVEARMSRTRDPGRQAHTKHMLRFRSKGQLSWPENKAVGDVAYEVLLRNAHDGSGSYQMLAGLIRFACENGLVISDGTVASIKVLHAGTRGRILARVVESADTVLAQGPRVSEKIGTWRGIDLQEGERMEFARVAHRLRFADAKGKITSPVWPEQLLLPRRPADVGSSLWSVFNVVQENALRGGIAAMGRAADGNFRRSTTREVKGIDGDVKLNRELWDLADRAATVKLAGGTLVEKGLAPEVVA